MNLVQVRLHHRGGNEGLLALVLRHARRHNRIQDGLLPLPHGQILRGGERANLREHWRRERRCADDQDSSRQRTCKNGLTVRNFGLQRFGLLRGAKVLAEEYPTPALSDGGSNGLP